MAYDDLLEWEARMDEDEAMGIFQGDPRHCPSHPHIQTSSNDGMFDGLCWMCEQVCDETAYYEQRHDEAKEEMATPEWQAEFNARASRVSIDIDNDDIPF